MERAPERQIFRYRAVERHLLELIEDGRLTPGSRAPSLRQMSMRMGVGIASVNHAYCELERKGVLESRPRSGFYIRGAPELELPAQAPAQPSAPQASTRSGLIRTVLESVGDRRLAPFGVVCPQRELLPVKALERLAKAIMRERPDLAIDYAPVPGLASLRSEIAFRMEEHRLSVPAGDVLVTNGCMEALSIALRSLTRPGDIVCIQSPTYYCFLQLLETLGLRAIEIPSRPDAGIDPGDVHAAVTRYDVRACIFSGNYNNPDGALTEDAVKREIVRMLTERGIPLVEDDVSGDVHFGPQRPETFKHYDAKGLVLYCSSFSKTMAPGYRLGIMLAGRYLEKALELKATTSVCTAGLPQETAARFMRSGQYARHLQALRGNVRHVMQTMQHHVAALFPEGTRMTRPAGGLVLWLELPQGVDAVELFYEARECGIGLVPGAIFSTQDRFTNCIRLSCGVTWCRETLQELARLGELAGTLALRAS